MMKVFLLFSLFCGAVHGYVPTVESLFRHGSNPEVSTNGVSLAFHVTKIIPGEKSGNSMNEVALLGDVKSESFFKIFLSKFGETFKVAQTQYDQRSFSEKSLVHKTYFPNFTPYSMRTSGFETQKGIFYGVLYSLALNDGAHLVSYLKSLGAPVRLNGELLNREKVEFLVSYKRYLALIAKDRNARKTEVNPMRPEDPAAKERANEIMAAPMYVDTNQVKLQREEGTVAWTVSAGNFEAVVSYKERDIQKIRYRSDAGDFEVICKDYYLANGTHAFPKFLIVKTFSGEQFQLETLNLRHFVDREDDLIKRLGNWDQILKGKAASQVSRPDFLL